MALTYRRLQSRGNSATKSSDSLVLSAEGEINIISDEIPPPRANPSPVTTC